MSSYCFFASDAQELLIQAGLKDTIESFAESNRKQTYALCKPLSKEDATYDYDKAVAIFISGMKPFFLDTGNKADQFEEYQEDFLEDISFLSEKYKYREKIGRKKIWEDLFCSFNPKELDLSILSVEKSSEGRLVDLIISLVVGSINDVKKITLEATDLLQTIKSKIILFDTDQTSFVFKNNTAKRFEIQGLAGSGKTELLLHKVKEIYANDLDARIAFTCYNKILSSNMKKRIPDFFDFMRVERQIDWDNKLFCFHSWGSSKNPISGMYRYICHSYGVTFGTLTAGSFDDLCKRAISEIKSLEGEPKFIFDYTFVDESQDFSSSFIELCELVTQKKVYVAGDVFQNIFRPIDDNISTANLVLKKCYRTDPKNLIFSHALGMGLLETPVLRWLKPDEWEACGYNFSQISKDRATLSRDPLRRFEDIPTTFKSTYIHSRSEGNTGADVIVQKIQEIVARHPSTTQGDIAVIYLDKQGYIYDSILELKSKVRNVLGWETNVSFETKTTDPDKLFISNINNAKGLEFPFVICYTLELTRNSYFRNALYTMMARSFLESHLILGRSATSPILEQINTGLDYLTTNNILNVRIPTKPEIENQKELFVVKEQFSVEEFVRDYCNNRGATATHTARLVARINLMLNDSTDFDEEYIESLLNLEYERHKKL